MIILPELFTDAEIDKIAAVGDAQPQVDWNYEPQCDKGSVVVKKSGAVLKEPQDTQWIWNRVLPHLTQYPVRRFEFLQYGVYQVGDAMDWHLDKGYQDYTADRLFGAILQLSNPKDYDGGILEIDLGGRNDFRVPRQKGLLVVLDSDVLHRVTRVSRGIRKTLVIWGLK